MVRNLVLIGVVLGCSASIPIIYQQNPAAFEALVRSTLDRTASEKEPKRPTVVASRAEERQETEVLLGRKVRIPANARGHYNAEFEFNGRRAEALVDTGATYVAINTSMARRIGVNLSPSDFKYEVNTANGRTRAAAATIDDIEIGRIFVRDVKAVVLDDEALDGVLVGMSFLGELRRFQVENGALLLEQ